MTTPETQAAPIPVTKAMILTWANMDIIRFGDGSVPAWELYVLPKHDVIRKHGL